jgi:hypothetical protein
MPTSGRWRGIDRGGFAWWLAESAVGSIKTIGVIDYCGRWIINPKPGDSHSRGEFFVKGVGWVPVDATAPEKPSDSANRKNFGTDPGLYFATSMETDWRIELPQFGVQELAWLHQYIVPYRYKDRPTWDGFKLRESFRLTER